MTAEAIIAALRWANRAVAMAVGVSLLAVSLFIIAEVVLRRFGLAIGGSDEISGYVMAGVSSWGLGFGLMELAHVRIDLLRQRLRPMGQVWMDLLALLALLATSAVITVQGWPVVAKSLTRGSTANTPLETPLWIPQAIWFGGWLWFTATAAVLIVCAAWLLRQGRVEAASAAIGVTDEVEAALR